MHPSIGDSSITGWLEDVGELVRSLGIAPALSDDVGRRDTGGTTTAGVSHSGLVTRAAMQEGLVVSEGSGSNSDSATGGVVATILRGEPESF